MKKKVLVTGADGFIGSHLCETLFKKKYEVTALSNYNHSNNIGWLDNIKNKTKIKIISGDIKDLSFCKNLLKNIDIVFHLAALISIPYSYVSPISYIHNNIIGTYNICEAAKLNKTKKIICTSTSEVYGTAISVPISENHPLQPQSPYSASKIGADSVALSYYYSYGLPVVLARPFNTYGPRQSNKAIIPTIITQILNNKKFINLGDLTPTRDFNYVEDTCRAFELLATTHNISGEVFNIGSNKEISILELVKLIKKNMNSKIRIKTDKLRIRPTKSEVKRLKADGSKIFKYTGYKPKISINKGIQKTITWFKNPSNMNKFNAEIYNI